MADDIDISNELAELFIQKSLQEQRERQGFDKESEEFCIDCDDEIPEKRREMIPGVQRCIGCQELHEARRKHFA